MTTWFISDTHFNHKNIIAYQNRPFASVQEMNTTMIENWNRTVSRKDEVFFLGDLSFKQNKDALRELIASLNGYKILLIGNHDRRYSPEVWMELGFDEVYKYPIIYKDFFILSHKPLYINENMPYRCIHGHLHSNVIQGEGSRLYYNVSVERINYTPVDFETIQDYFLENE